MTHRLIFICLLIMTEFCCIPKVYSARTLTDQTGRQITLSDNPRRIVSLAPSITEIIFALEQQCRLKGVTRFSNYPPEAKELPDVGSYKFLHLEKILALKPDICIAIGDGNPPETIRRLHSLNIPVYTVDPRNLENVMETILEIGILLNVETIANEVVENMRTRIRRIKSLSAKAEHHPRVFLQIALTPIVSVGTDTFLHELVTFAGGENVMTGYEPYPRMNREQVLAHLPEVLIITSMVRGGVFEKVKAEWSQWTQMPAAKNKRIFLVDSDVVDRPTPRLVEGLELLFSLIHPELSKSGQ